MLHEFEVIADGHTHAGRLLERGEIVSLEPARAARFPTVFQPKRTKPPKADRPARHPTPATTASED